MNAVGLALVPVTLALKPIGVLAPGASEPFQLALVTVTCSLFCVQVPSHPLVTCWSPENVKTSVQLVIAVAPLVIVILPENPPGQLVVTEYATEHPADAAFAVLASVAAALAIPPASTTAPRIVTTFRVLYRNMTGP